MSLLLMEGWDSLSALGRKYSVIGSPSLNSSIKRNGSQSFRASGAGNYIILPLDTTYSLIYIGFALYCGSFGSVTSDSTCMIGFYKSGEGLQCGVGINTEGKIVVYRLSTQIGLSDNALIVGSWYFIEIKATIANSIGSNEFQVKVNGDVWLNLSVGTDTQQQASNNISDIYLRGNAAAAVIYIDDLYVLNANGAKNSSFLGDIKVLTLYPNGNGNANQFDGSDGNQVDNYLLVDEAQDNGDTDYTESNTIGNKDQYAFDNIPDTPEIIHGVSARGIIRKSDVGSRVGRLLCRSSGSDYEGSSFNPATSFLAYDYIWEDDPDTASDWLKSGVDAAEFGIKVQA